MVRRAKPTAMPQAMIRSAFLLALASMLWAASAHAQASDADLVTRVDHLEAEIRDLTGTIEQLPGGQVDGALQTLVAFLRDGKKPEQQVTLLTPIAITSENLDKAERLNEVK